LHQLLTFSKQFSIPPSLSMLQAAPSTALVSAVVPTSLFVPMDVSAYSIHGARRAVVEAHIRKVYRRPRAGHLLMILPRSGDNSSQITDGSSLPFRVLSVKRKYETNPGLPALRIASPLGYTKKQQLCTLSTQSHSQTQSSVVPTLLK
jgi:hypothetical protein